MWLRKEGAMSSPATPPPRTLGWPDWLDPLYFSPRKERDYSRWIEIIMDDGRHYFHNRITGPRGLSCFFLIRGFRSSCSQLRIEISTSKYWHLVDSRMTGLISVMSIDLGDGRWDRLDDDEEEEDGLLGEGLLAIKDGVDSDENEQFIGPTLGEPVSPRSAHVAGFDEQARQLPFGNGRVIFARESGVREYLRYSNTEDPCKPKKLITKKRVHIRHHLAVSDEKIFRRAMAVLIR